MTVADILASVEHLWSLSSRFAETRAHHGYRQITVVLAGRIERPEFTDLLTPLAPVRGAWLSRLEPGGYIVEHIDAGPYYERWQIPLSPHGRLFQDGEPVACEVGVPYMVRQFDWHHVRNDDEGDRIALVVDRDIALPIPTGPLRLR